MARLTALDPENAGAAKDTLAAINASLGVTPNLFRTIANSPTTLSGIAALSGALAHGRLNARVRESIALTVSQENGCDYCLSAHTALGTMAGLTPEALRAARTGEAENARTQAILTLTDRIVATRGNVGDEAVKAAKDAGLSDGEIIEVLANVALTIFTNYVNNLSDTAIDFPIVRANELVAH